MHRNNQNNVYRSSSYLSPSSRTTSRRWDNQHSFHPSTAPNSALRLQQQYQSLTTISDLAEPISVFDDLKFPPPRRSTITPFPPVYHSPSRTSLTDSRLATVSAMRERLLIDIQHNMKEIDRDITSLEEQSIISRYIPSPLSSSIVTARQSSFDKRDDKQLWPKKPRKVYSVVPRITSQPKKTSTPAISSRMNKIIVPSYVGQYHYGPETAENVIRKGDPENSELKLVVKEIPKLTLREPLTLDKFRREQSAIPQNRALIFVPEYDDNNETGLNETVENFQQRHSTDPDNARILTVPSSNTSGSANRIKIQDFQLFTHTAPKPKVEIPTKSPAVSDKAEVNLINPMILSPVKHVHESKKLEETHSPSPQITKNNSDADTAYFFSDYGNEGDGEEDLISIDPSQFILPVESENLSDDNISDTLIGQSQISLLNSQYIQDQPSIIQNNNEEFKERESQTTTHTITPTSILPSKNVFLTPIVGNMQIQHINQDREDGASTTISNTDTIARTPESLLTIERKASSKTMNSLRQRSVSLDRSSQNQSPFILSRGATISSTDVHKLSTQHTSIESQRNSPLPVPLNSPNSNDIRPSTSRSTTPERRSSISSLDQSRPLTPIDVSNLIDHLPMNSERDIPSPLVNLESLQENKAPHHNNTNREETTRLPVSSNHNLNRTSEPKPPVEDRIDYDEIFPRITASQRRSRLSLIVQRPPKPKEKKPIDDQPEIAIPQTDQITTQKPERHVVFATEIIHEPIKESVPIKTWRERIDDILSKQHFPVNKYSHIKSRVNTFANFEYRSKQFTVVQKKKSRRKTEKTSPTQSIPPAKRLTPQILGRLHRLPDGRPTVFHEKLDWKSPSKLRSYSLENLNYKPHQSDIKILNKKPRWHSESRVRKLITHTRSLPIIPDDNEPSIIEQSSENAMKIFDVQQSSSKFQESLLSDSSWNSKRSDKIIFDGKLVWRKKSKLKDSIWENINYQPKKSTVQIFHEPIRWNRQSKIQITHSLTLDIQPKAKYWSETDLYQFKKKKALFYQYRNLKWNDIVTTDNQYSFVSLTQDYSEDENFNEKSPANRPKWNSVSKTRSLNLVYNPNVLNSNSIRRGWDLDLRRKRVHKLPPLKRKRVQDEIRQLAIEGPISNNPSAIDENYGQVLITQDQSTSIEYGTIPSRRSSKALVPLPHIPDLPLLSETPRSQRPVQQEWYDELSKSRLTHRTEVGRRRNNSFQDSNGSVYQITTPREFRSSTRNSQNSVLSSVLLDSSIRTNRATELRLSQDMEEHHQHSHDPSQSMPFEIRGFRLEGTQLSVPNNATIRPLSNVSYHTSERVKTRRLYPWSTSHQNGTSSRNSSLLPITELRHPSFNSSTIEVPQLIQEE